MTEIAYGMVCLKGGSLIQVRGWRYLLSAARFEPRLPWAVASSSARAIQRPATEIWSGKDANVKTAQEALAHRASCNRAAQPGDNSTAMKSTGGVQ